jgi:hypothetical protein
MWEFSGQEIATKCKGMTYIWSTYYKTIITGEFDENSFSTNVNGMCIWLSPLDIQLTYDQMSSYEEIEKVLNGISKNINLMIQSRWQLIMADL